MTSMDYDGHKINWNQESTDQILAKIGIVGGTAINIPMLVINGYGTTKTWGSALSTYNLNHDAFFNGISGTQSAWNRMMFDMNRSFSIAELDRGGIKMMGSPGDPLGIFEGIGMALSASDNRSMNLAAIPFLIISKNSDDALKVLAAEKGLWSSTKNMSSVENAFAHYKKHGSEFPEFKNVLQYTEGTHQFMNTPPAGTLIKTRVNGDILKYDPLTNTFGVTNASGTPKTLFRPKDGIDYWLKQK